MSTNRRERPAPVAAGRAARNEHGAALTEKYNAWRRWAHHVHVDRLTARQAMAVQLVRAGIAQSPEAALALLDMEAAA